ncbi:hypothetical protein IAQ61_003929 [Plenodomus lingam]|uniref:uncharacterized protein n=1 Tax=Leptosphaeria maculans TaxID=5022 RepID=UPI00332516EF|nr:hypothetical protein IAQ61_003929 [Plenodomus lingam]
MATEPVSLEQIVAAMDLDKYFSHHSLDNLPAESGLDGEFSLYKTLSGFPLQHKALTRLRRCAFIVGPIMRRRGWQMPILSELLPFDDCLGKTYFTRHIRYRTLRNEVTLIPQEMRLRLRYPNDPGSILPMKQIMRTVLHELAHFHHRNHFFSFYRFNAVLLAELECDVREGCHREKVGWREIPSMVASCEEMRNSMIRDAGEKIRAFLGSLQEMQDNLGELLTY